MLRELGGLPISFGRRNVAGHGGAHMLESVEAMTTQLDEERIAFIDLADELQVRKQRLFKLVSRLQPRCRSGRSLPESGVLS